LGQTAVSAYYFRRVLQVVPILFGIATIVFFLVHAAPGGPIVALGGEFATAEYQAAIERLYGLDRPIVERYWRFLSRLLQGDLGQSYFFKAPVLDVVLEKLPVTLLLVLPAIGMSSFIGIWLGVNVARQRGAAETSMVSLTLCCNAIPVFWLGQILLLILAVKADLFPVSGMTDARTSFDGWRHWLDVARHLALPCLTLTIHQLAFVVLITRASLSAEMRRPYFLTALAKGNSVPRAQYIHAFRNGALPVITLIGNRIGWILGGAILVENVFAWPGLGRLIITSSLNRDYPMILGIVLVAALLTVTANLVVDLIYNWIDPRIDQRRRIDEH
jgi:peptide/nickel transport system permease protein